MEIVKTRLISVDECLVQEYKKGEISARGELLAYVTTRINVLEEELVSKDDNPKEGVTTREPVPNDELKFADDQPADES